MTTRSRLTSRITSVPVNHSQISLIPRGGDTVKKQNTSYLPPPGDRFLIKSAYMPLLSPYLSRVRGGGGFNWLVHNRQVWRELVELISNFRSQASPFSFFRSACQSSSQGKNGSSLLLLLANFRLLLSELLDYSVLLVSLARSNARNTGRKRKYFL